LNEYNVKCVLTSDLKSRHIASQYACAPIAQLQSSGENIINFIHPIFLRNIRPEKYVSLWIKQWVYTIVPPLSPVHTVAEKCDCRRFLRQSHFSATVWTGL